MLVEHPTGASPVSLTTEQQDGKTVVTEAAIISTARALFEGRVLVPSYLLGPIAVISVRPSGPLEGGLP